jgi:hypothetical protein
MDDAMLATMDTSAAEKQRNKKKKVKKKPRCVTRRMQNRTG